MPINTAKLKANDGTFHGKKIDAIVDTLRRLEITQGRGYKLRQTPLGTTLDISPSNGGGGESCPFTLRVTTTETAGTLALTVSPGTVNSLLPDNYADTFFVPDTGLRFLTITVLSNGSQITNVSLAVESTNPPAQDPTEWALPVSASFVLGVIVDGVPYKVIGCGSIQLTGYEVFKEEVTPPAEPGEMPYKPYYAWQMSIV